MSGANTWHPDIEALLDRVDAACRKEGVSDQALGRLVNVSGKHVGLVLRREAGCGLGVLSRMLAVAEQIEAGAGRMNP